MDALDSILFLAKVGNSRGRLYLSQIYGSGNKIFQQVEDIAGAIVAYFCPRCDIAFPEVGTCECMASKITLYLNDGGYVEVCTRNGCIQHRLEFKKIDDAFRVFQNQDEVGFF